MKVSIIDINEFVDFRLELVSWIMIKFFQFVFIFEDVLKFTIVISFIKYDISIGFICLFIVMFGYLCNYSVAFFSCRVRMVEYLCLLLDLFLVTSAFRTSCFVLGVLVCFDIRFQFQFAFGHGWNHSKDDRLEPSWGNPSVVESVRGRRGLRIYHRYSEIVWSYYRVYYVSFVFWVYVDNRWQFVFYSM